MRVSLPLFSKPRKYKNQETVDIYIRDRMKYRDDLIREAPAPSGYTFLLFNTAKELVRFKKVIMYFQGHSGRTAGQPRVRNLICHLSHRVRFLENTRRRSWKTY